MKTNVEILVADSIEVSTRMRGGLHKVEALAPNQRNDKHEISEGGNTEYEDMGTILRGEKKNIKVFVTYNRHTNTYFQDFSTIIPEYDIAFGVWDYLTPEGEARVSLLRKFYEKKVPPWKQRLIDKLSGDEQPGDKWLKKQGIVLPVAERLNLNPEPDHETMELYDRDIPEVASVVEADIGIKLRRAVKADVDFSSNSEFDRIHSGLEVALTSMGIKMDQVSNSSEEKKYKVSYPDTMIANIEGDSDVEDFTEVLRVAVGAAGWQEDEGMFPVTRRVDDFAWLARDPSGSVRMILTLRDSTVRFLYQP